MARVLVCSDAHSGHRVGLTHPDYQQQYHAKSTTQRNKFALVQRETWDWFAATVESLRPIDALIIPGDSVDGKGQRSGGTEQLTTDMNEQVDMAAAWIEFVGAKKVAMVYGTPYHVGTEDDWETPLAKTVKATIGSHEWYNIEGVIFDVKHKIGGSQIPHGRHTAIARDHLWNQLWAERDQQPKADVMIRGHVHYHQFVGGPGWLAMTCPALQGYGSKFGARQCSGTVDIGLLSFDAHGGAYSWQAHLANLTSQKVRPAKL
jgi:hypothetical protein